MSTNTIEENQRRCQFGASDQVWLFGYGSLIYLVDFPYLDSRPACISGWSRRFWQGSHDHRGTEANPGRVVTLIEEADALCGGIAYLVEAPVFRQLDEREKNGYLRSFHRDDLRRWLAGHGADLYRRCLTTKPISAKPASLKSHSRSVWPRAPAAPTAITCSSWR